MEMMRLYKLSDLVFSIQIFKSKASSIIIGFWYWLKNENKDLYIDRSSICSICPSNRRYRCGECGCFKQAKLRLKDSNCPLDKW